MANTKISALTAGAPALASDLLPIDRSGANYSLQVSDILATTGQVPTAALKTVEGTGTKVQLTNAGTTASGDVVTYDGNGNVQDSGTLLSSLAPLASPALSGTPTAPTPSATTNNTDIATAAFVGSQIVDGTPAANSIAKVVASRVLTAQTAPDGNDTTLLYTVPSGGAGVYRTTGYLVCRTKNSGAWTVNVDVAWPSGTNLSASAILSANMVTPAAPSTGNCATMYLHVGDAITCGTVTGTGSRDNAVFDVAWVVERLV
jgi:hypothetical protein